MKVMVSKTPAYGAHDGTNTDDYFSDDSVHCSIFR